jgi:DNA-binding transcriptional LysR family regulator
VAETGGFSAAARTLNLTQSAVSLQIKRLEQQTGVDLFQRNSRRVRLTEEGGALLPYARRFLNLQESARSALAQARLRPAVRVGLSEEQAGCYLPAILPVFSRYSAGGFRKHGWKSSVIPQRYWSNICSRGCWIWR